MNACAPSLDGASRSTAASRAVRAGFTLLEMCLVLFIIALMLGVTLPAIQTAFVEQAIRHDAQQLSMMIKTGMQQSSEEHRRYVLDLTATTLSLHPVDEDASDDSNSSGQDSASDDTMTAHLKDPTKLLVPDPKKPNTWVPLQSTSWFFEPGELCPAQSVRLSRGNAWLELNFNALTGNVEHEGAYLP